MNFKNTGRSFLGRENIVLWLAVFALFATFFFSQQIGGETWDERSHEVGYNQLISIATGVIGGERDLKFNDMNADMEFYGVLPVAPAMLVTGAVGKVIDLSADERDRLLRFLLHLSAFCWGVGAAVLLYLTILMICGDRTFAFLGGGFLMLYPTWLGHSFFNYKDLAMAFFFMLALYGALVATSTELRRFRIGAAVVGLASVGAAAVKLPGLAIMVVQWGVIGLASLQQNEKRVRIPYLIVTGVLVVVATYLVTPAAWLEPVRFSIESITYLSRHLWGGCTLTMGECLRPTAEGWSSSNYLLLWLTVRLPLVILVAAVPAALFLMCGGERRERIVVAAAFLPMILITLRNSSFYDGIRHILFFLPPLFAVVTLAAARLARKHGILSSVLKFAMIANIATCIVDNVTLFPYNYVYFNEASRQYAQPKFYELEYWGFSLREAMSQLKSATADRKDGHLRYFAYPAHLATPFAGEKFESIKSRDEARPFFWVSITRRNTKPDEDCVTVSEVSRRLVLAPAPLKLAFVAECK